MRSLLLVLLSGFASATAHAADGGISKIAGDFGISWPLILAQIVNFTVVAYVLWRFAFKPVLATLDERQRKIADGLRYAEETKAKLAATQQESAAMMKQASVDAARLVEEARKSAKDYLDRHTQETAVKVNDMLAKGHQALELEQRKMMADARVEIARLVIATTERVLSQQLSDADRTRYSDSAARELADV